MEADTTMAEAREKIFQHRKEITASTMAVFMATSTVLGVLTGYTIYQNKKKVRKLVRLRIRSRTLQ